MEQGPAQPSGKGWRGPEEEPGVHSKPTEKQGMSTEETLPEQLELG